METKIISASKKNNSLKVQFKQDDKIIIKTITKKLNNDGEYDKEATNKLIEAQAKGLSHKIRIGLI